MMRTTAKSQAISTYCPGNLCCEVACIASRTEPPSRHRNLDKTSPRHREPDQIFPRHREPRSGVATQWSKAVQKSAKKRSSYAINKHFEPIFNAEITTQVVFQRFFSNFPA